MAACWFEFVVIVEFDEDTDLDFCKSYWYCCCWWALEFLSFCVILFEFEFVFVILFGVNVDEDEFILLTAIGSRVLVDCDCDWSDEPTVFLLIDVKDEDMIGVGVEDCPDNEDEEDEEDEELRFAVGVVVDECGVVNCVGCNGGGLRCNVGEGDEDDEFE